MEELGEKDVPGASAPGDEDKGKLGELLVSSGRLNAAELDTALRLQAHSGERLGEILLAHDLISRPGLGTALTEQQRGELTTESGFGTGLRAAMELSHRRRRPRSFVAAGHGALESNEGEGARPATDP